MVTASPSHRARGRSQEVESSVSRSHRVDRTKALSFFNRGFGHIEACWCGGSSGLASIL